MKSTAKKSIKPGKGYRILKTNELVREGDEFYNRRTGLWQKSGNFPGTQDKFAYRRKMVRKYTPRGSKAGLTLKKLVAAKAILDANHAAVVAAPKSFKVGDRVVLMSTYHGCSDSNPVWGKHGHVVGTVDETERGLGGLPLGVQWDNGTHNSYGVSDLKLHSEIAPAPKLYTEAQLAQAKADAVNAERQAASDCILVAGKTSLTGSMVLRSSADWLEKECNWPATPIGLRALATRLETKATA